MPTATADDITTTQLGQILRSAREAADGSPTQKELGVRLADAMGLDKPILQSTVSCWEKGTVIPRVPLLIEVAKVLKVDARALFDAALYDHEAGR